MLVSYNSENMKLKFGILVVSDEFDCNGIIFWEKLYLAHQTISSSYKAVYLIVKLFEGCKLNGIFTRNQKLSTIQYRENIELFVSKQFVEFCIWIKATAWA